jgi:hypothetical protein
MLDSSSFIADTSRDEEIVRKFFGDLNRDIIGPPGDGKIIIIETTIEIESTTAPTSADDAPVEAMIDNSDDQESNKDVDGRDPSGHSAGNP